MSGTVPAAQLAALVGKEVGVSDWFALDQARIDAFADITEDWQFIHVDPVKAKATPFGGTIAHGFLVLSMLSRLIEGRGVVLQGVYMGVNYGFDKVRFVSPVRAGARIRGRFVLSEAKERDRGQWMLRYAVTVEVEGGAKPAVTAEWLTVQAVE